MMFLKEVNMRRTVYISYFLKWAMRVMIAVALLLEVGFWICLQRGAESTLFDFKAMVHPQLHLMHKGVEISDLHRFLGFLVSSIPLSCYVIGIWNLSSLFGAFSRQRFLVVGNIRLIRNAALAFFAQQVAYFLAFPLMSLLFTYQNPVGERMIMLAYGTDQFQMLILSLSVWAAASIFKLSVKLQEDSQWTV
jgi:hypothetical protein